MEGILSGPVLSSERDRGRLSKCSYMAQEDFYVFFFFFEWREISCGKVIKEDKQIRRLQEQNNCESGEQLNCGKLLGGIMR